MKNLNLKNLNYFKKNMSYTLSEIQINSLHDFYENIRESHKIRQYTFDEILYKIHSTVPIKYNYRYIWQFKRAKGIELNIITNQWRFHGLGFH